MERVLWWSIGGSRGGMNRVRIIRTLAGHPMNANQLAETLELDYKTVRHHLRKLENNNVLMSMGEDYGRTYFLTEQMEAKCHSQNAGNNDSPYRLFEPTF